MSDLDPTANVQSAYFIVGPTVGRRAILALIRQFQIRLQIIKNDWKLKSIYAVNHIGDGKTKNAWAYNDNYLHRLANLSQYTIVTLPWYEQVHGYQRRR